jgi:uncharacterized membrane protein YciS (DUF1049 family)
MIVLSLAVFFISGFILACLLTAPKMHELETELWELRRKLGRCGNE